MSLPAKKIGLILFTFLLTLFMAYCFVLPVIFTDFPVHASWLIAFSNHRFLLLIISALLLIYIDHFTRHKKGTTIRWAMNAAVVLWIMSFVVEYLLHPILFLVRNVM